MSLAPGTRLGTYEVTGLLGTGGMGEVYRARDTRLKREVAVKVLPGEFSRDPDRVARFHREAEALAALSHPNIAGIHELGEADGSVFLVLELVEGETLLERLRRGPLPVDEALMVATQIAGALETAHERGILHRDLKPANIKITPEGRVKVLDFGLAKLLEAPGAPSALTGSPTVLTGTALGVILGTASYMSPEQAKGLAATRSSDVWGFGCVLFEMLVGQAPFRGDTVAEIMGEILKEEPDWTRLPADTPLAIRRLLGRCLRKDRGRRLHDMADVRIEIEDADHESPAPIESARPLGGRRERWAWTAAAAFALIAAAAMFVWLRGAPPDPEMRVEINAPWSADLMSFAISPDGQKLVFTAEVDDTRSLWVRSLESAAARPLPGTADAQSPFWSPDSRSVGFFAGTTLKRIEIAGGPPRVLADAVFGRGGAWSKAGVILFAPATGGPLVRVPAEGGEAVAFTQLTAGEFSHRYPTFLPDDRHFLYFAAADTANQGVYVAALDDPAGRRVVDADAAAVFASSGHLLFARQGTLLAQRFDVERLVVSGEPFVVAEQVAVGASIAAVSASPAGPIAYRTAATVRRRQLLWFDRGGSRVGAVGARDADGMLNPVLSPDGRHVAIERRANANRDVWLLDTARGVLSRVTTDPSEDATPIWSADGSRVIFASGRSGPFDLYEKTSSGSDAERVLLASPHNKVPMDISPDGSLLLYRHNQPRSGFDLWLLPLAGDRKPFAFAETSFTEGEGQFSPDGKWIAYQSNESGRFQVYAQPFRESKSRTMISTEGGAQPRWRPDGRELFYVALDGRLMAVPITWGASGGTLEAGAPVALFPTRMPGGAVQGVSRQQYDVSLDGQRFLINSLTEESATSPITLILNWRPAVAR